jgi:hypothetical protein
MAKERFQLHELARTGSPDTKDSITVKEYRVDPDRDYQVRRDSSRGVVVGSCKVERDDLGGFVAVPDFRLVGLNLEPTQVRFASVWKAADGIADLQHVLLQVEGH